MGPNTGKWWLTWGAKLVNDLVIYEGPGVKALKIFPRYGGHR